MPLLAYTSDLHGNGAFYVEFLNLARKEKVQAAIIGGDLLPHTSSRRTAIEQQRRFIATELRQILERHTEAGGPPVYVICGNDDWLAACAELQALEAAGLVFDLHMRALPLGNYCVAGYACVPLTPFSIKDWERPESVGIQRYSFDHALHSQGGEIAPLSEAEFLALPTIGQELAELAKASDPSRTIYVCHTPPYNTGLDRTRTGLSVGSRDLRRFIEVHQPPLTLHGHIHEAPYTSNRYASRIGSTWCINPGQGSQLHAVLVDPDDLPASLRHTIIGNAVSGTLPTA